MNKNLTKLIVLCCIFALGLSNNAFAQCTVIATDAGPYTDFSTPPCDATCGTPVAPAFEVWGNEAYVVNVTAGSEYVFQFCTGYSAATWPATITVTEWDGSIAGNLLGTVDGCSITFSAFVTGEVIIYVSVTTDCGGAYYQTNNGAPTLDCGPAGATCPVIGPCEAGTMASTAQSVCAVEPFEIAVSGTLEADGGFAINYSNVGTDGAGGTGAPVDITGYAASDFPYFGDSDLNGILSTNSLPPFTGTWNAKVYALDVAGAPCDSTSAVAITFLDSLTCVSSPCDAGVLTSALSQDVCGTDGTFDITTDGSEVAAGGYTLLFDDANGGTGGLAGGFNLVVTLPVNFDNDLNGILSNNNFDPLAGQWDVTLYAINGNGDACDLTATTSVFFLDAADPACAPVDDCLTTAPANHSVEMTTPTTAYFDWDNVPGAIKYQVFYRRKGETNPWTITSSGAVSFKTVSGLLNKRNYQYKIRAQCADGTWSPFTEIPVFYTSQCAIPTGIASSYLDNTRMRVRWDNNPDEIKGKIKYREVGTTAWTTQNSQPGQNFLFVNSLPANAVIQYKVRSNCGDGSDWSNFSELNTHDLSGPVSRETQLVSGTKLFPNPANESLNLTFNTLDASEVSIVISDNLGKAVVTSNNTYQEGTQTETLDISRLANGYYFVTISSKDGVETLKFVKSK